MKIAILVVVDIPDGAAIAHRVMMLSQGLVAWSHEVHIIAPYKFSPGPLTDEIEGVKIHWGAYLPREVLGTFLAKINLRILLFKKTKQLLAQGLEWLILYDIGAEALPYLFLAKHYHCLVATETCDLYQLSFKSLRGFFNTLSKRIGYRLITPLVNINFAISRHIEIFLRKRAPNIPRLIVRAPVDTAKFRNRPDAAAAFRRDRGLSDDMIIGYFGSVLAVKGLAVLLRAARIVKQVNIPFRILITGNTAKNPGLLKLIDELDLQEQVILTGYLPHEQLIDIMSVPDILVEPKIKHGENIAGFPQKLAEYLSLGKPIVASAIGDLTEFLRDRENALLCQPGDPETMAQALLELMADVTLRERLALKARETAMHYFEGKKIAGQVATALAQISKGNAPGNYS
jgi:glycosyltransferase involved in cell wall biosynthesis